MAGTRKTKTEAKIQAALTELLPAKGLAGITVSDICRSAGINRGTFYAHYVDKFDLVTKQIEGICREITDIVLAPGSSGPDDCALFPKERVLACVTYVYDNYPFIAALSSNGTDDNLKQHVKDLIAELFERSAAAHGISTRFAEDAYAREMLTSSVTSVFWLWLSKGCPETPQQITDIVWSHKSLSPEELVGGLA